MGLAPSVFVECEEKGEVVLTFAPSLRKVNQHFFIRIYPEDVTEALTYMLSPIVITSASGMEAMTGANEAWVTVKGGGFRKRLERSGGDEQLLRRRSGGSESFQARKLTLGWGWCVASKKLLRL